MTPIRATLAATALCLVADMSASAQSERVGDAIEATLTTSDLMSVPETPIFAWMPEAGDKIAFRVLRNGNKFGTHTISFFGDAETEMTVRSQVSLKAGLGPITVFKYALDTTETWRDGVLVGLQGSGNNDGKKMQVSAASDAEMLSVEGTEFSGEVPLGIVPSSHWNIAQVQGDQMVSTEDGEIIAVKSQKVGREPVKIGAQTVQADRYLLDAAIDLDLWYDDQARLVKLAFETKGQSIVYQLQNLY